MKNRKGDKEIREILLGLDLEGDKVTVDIEGENFLIPVDNLLDLFDKLQFRRREGPKRESEFPEGFDTLRHYVQAIRLLKKGLHVDKAAGVMGVSADVFRKFLGRGASSYSKERQMIQDEMTKFSAEDLVKRWPPRSEKPEYVFLEIPAAKPLLKTGKSTKEIAAALNLDEEELGRWIEANQRLIDLA